MFISLNTNMALLLKERGNFMKDKITNGMLAFADALSSNKYMSAIKNSFTTLLPVIIAGAFCTLILNVVLSTTTTGISLAKIEGFAWLANLAPIFSAANYATLQFFGIGLVILIAIELGHHYGHDEHIVPIVALSAYVTLITTSVMVNTPAGEVLKVADVIAKQFTNAQSLFLGMVASILATEIYVRLVDSGKLSISMPETVPYNVAKSFSILFPAVLTIIIVSSIGYVFTLLTGYTMYDAIAKWIQGPLTGILTGLPGYLFLFFMTTVLWIFGIHGTQVLKPVYEATLLLALAQNSDAVTAGMAPTNILNTSFQSSFSTITGAGITGGLIIAILLFSKRDDYKTIAKLSIAPGLFNINETMTFGLPIVLNPVLAIPFMLAPIASASFAYFMTKIGFAVVMSYNVPWTTPLGLQAFLATGGHLGTVLVQLMSIVISFLIYTPFVLISNRLPVKNEG